MKICLKILNWEIQTKNQLPLPGNGPASTTPSLVLSKPWDVILVSESPSPTGNERFKSFEIFE